MREFFGVFGNFVTMYGSRNTSSHIHTLIQSTSAYLVLIIAAAIIRPHVRPLSVLVAAALVVTDLLVPASDLRHLTHPYPTVGAAELAPRHPLCYALGVLASPQLYLAKRSKNPGKSAQLHTIEIM